jgi:hypothetical protein
MVTRQSAPPPGAFPEFAPVSLRARHDGWTAQRQRHFIEALASTGCVAEAARAAQMSLEACYKLRRHPNAHEFRRAWEQALDLACELLEDVAITRAIEGTEQPVYHFGAVVGTRRVYNDRLIMFLLRNRRAARFAADSVRNADEMIRTRLEKLKAEWRAEWEAEGRAERSESSEATVLSINKKLELMRQRTLAMMSPRTRALHDAWQAAREEDEASGCRPHFGGADGDEDEEAAE